MQLLHNFQNELIFDGDETELFQAQLQMQCWKDDHLLQLKIDPLGHYKGLFWPLWPMDPEDFQKLLHTHQIQNHRIGVLDYFKNKQGCNVYQAEAHKLLWLWAMGEYQPQRWKVYAVGCWQN